MTIVGVKATTQWFKKRMYGDERGNEPVIVYFLNMLVQVKTS